MSDDALAKHLTFSNPGWLIRRMIYRDLRRASALATGRLLDIGCGQMPYRQLFPNVASYIGVEHHNALHPDDRPTAWADGFHLPFSDAAFDTVLATQVLEHVPEPAQLLAEISRALRVGGVLLLTAPHIWEVHEQPHDYYRYTCFGLEYLLKQAGFDVEQIVPQGGFLAMAAQRGSHFIYKICYKLRLRPAGIASAFVINSLGLVLDKIYTYEGETLNYLAIARKRAPQTYA
jgi:SAM-dependent methyltransferase